LAKTAWVHYEKYLVATGHLYVKILANARYYAGDEAPGNPKRHMKSRFEDIPSFNKATALVKICEKTTVKGVRIFQVRCADESIDFKYTKGTKLTKTAWVKPVHLEEL